MKVFLKMIDLSIIIVGFNSKEFLKKCIDSIYESGFKNFEVIVVDNNSKDGTVSELQNDKRVKLISNKKNIGFSKANNQGVKISKGKFLLFLNPDTSVYPKTLDFMFDFMNKNPKVGAATCKVILPNGKLDDSSHRGFPTPWNSFCYFSGLSKFFPHSKLFSGYTLGFLGETTIHEIDSLGGSFMMIRRQAGEEVNWWDEDYFFYGEDLDFCFRLKQNGWKIFYVPKVSVLHYKGLSSGIKKHSQHLSHADLETKKAATAARFDAMKIFYRKHYLRKYPWIITWFVMNAINLKFWFTLKSI